MLIAKYKGEDTDKIRKGMKVRVRRILQCFFRDEYELEEVQGRFDSRNFEIVGEDEQEPTTAKWANRP